MNGTWKVIVRDDIYEKYSSWKSTRSRPRLLWPFPTFIQPSIKSLYVFTPRECKCVLIRRFNSTVRATSTFSVVLYDWINYLNIWEHVTLLTGSKMSVSLHPGLVTIGITLATVVPVWTIIKSRSNIIWNGKTWQNVAGLTFGSKKEDYVWVFILFCK